METERLENGGFVDPLSLADSACCEDDAKRSKALDAVKRLRSGGLLEFARLCSNRRGWGRGLRRAVASWYTSRSPAELAAEVAKETGPAEGEFGHRDLVRLSHPRAGGELNDVLGWIARGWRFGSLESPPSSPHLLPLWEREVTDRHGREEMERRKSGGAAV